MGCAGIAALLLGLRRLDASGGGCVSPGGNLDDVIRDAIEVANVVLAASAELAPDWHAEEVGEDGRGLSFGAVALALLWVSHGCAVRLNQPLGRRMVQNAGPRVSSAVPLAIDSACAWRSC